MPVNSSSVRSNAFHGVVPPPPAEVVGTRTRANTGKESSSSVVKGSGVDDLMNVALLGHVRNAVVENCEANFIPNIDAPLGRTLDAEMEIFSSTFEDRFEGASEQTKYANVIQNIQARFKSGGFTYAFDEDTEGVPEYWSTPTEVVADSGQGIDCEDFAFMAREYGESVKEEMGIGGRFVVHGGLVDHDPEKGHAICVYHADDGNQYVIDGTYYESGRGDISQLKTLAEYTEERNFEWFESGDGNLIELELGAGGSGATRWQLSDYAADLDAEGKPVDVVAVENNGENINHAVDVKDELDAEPAGFKGMMSFFGEKREGLGDLSLLELGSLVMGPLLIIGDALKFRSESRKVSKDRKLAQTGLGGSAADLRYHLDKRNIAGVKGVLDTVRYVTFIVICAGAGALAAPIVALGVSALRCGVGAVEAMRSMDKKWTRLRRRRVSRKLVSKTLAGCHPKARGLLQSRINYKINKNRLSGSPIFGVLKSLAFTGTGLGMVATGVAAIAVGTLVAVNPVILGVALGFGILLGVLRTGESIYNGALLREQKKAFRAEESLISARLNRIRNKDEGWFSRIGASINLFGWVADAVDDKTAAWPVGAQWALRTLLAPFYAVAFLTERKTFNEEAVFKRLGAEFARKDVSAKERTALLKSAVAYYGISRDEILLKWMTSREMTQLKRFAKTSKKPTSPIVRRYLRLWLKKRDRFLVSDHQDLVDFRADALDLVKVKFAGGYGLA